MCIRDRSGLIILLTGLNTTLKSVEDEVQVVAYLRDSSTQSEISDLQTSLRNMPQVTQVAYVSKDQAYNDFVTRHPEQVDVIKSLPNNPMPASLRINLRDPNDYVDVASYLKNNPDVERVLNIKQTVDQMVTVINVLRAGGVVVLLVVGLIAVSYTHLRA